MQHEGAVAWRLRKETENLAIAAGSRAVADLDRRGESPGGMPLVAVVLTFAGRREEDDDVRVTVTQESHPEIFAALRGLRDPERLARQAADRVQRTDVLVRQKWAQRAQEGEKAKRAVMRRLEREGRRPRPRGS